MSTSKVSETYEVQEEHQAWLQSMASEYALKDASKALRILLDYAIAEGDLDEIFTKIRCRHCG